MKLALWSLVSLMSLVAVAQTGFAQSEQDYDEIKIERISHRYGRGVYQLKCGQVVNASYWKSCSRGECATGETLGAAINECRRRSNYPDNCSRPVKISDTRVERCD